MASSSEATLTVESCVRGYHIYKDIWQRFDWQWLRQLPLPQSIRVLRLPCPDSALLQVDA